ncbi:MAG: succinate dehydrogenase, hydrophobic membrane anchor protein [Cellvibrionaceae bacterium]|nr:succinate dehydrogenase, hydrophobic membrane anchor protein [Cellvibrionaceae bacterium]
MVTAVTSFGRSGLYDWLVQRFTAIVLAAYTVLIVAFIAMQSNLDYATWVEFHRQTWMRIFSLLCVLSVIAHSWIGLWGVLTDYITTRMIGGSAVALRVSILGLFVVVAFAFVVWAVEILWGF